MNEYACETMKNYVTPGHSSEARAYLTNTD